MAVLCKSQMLLADFAALIIKRILPGYIHRSGRILLRHLGEAGGACVILRLSNCCNAGNRLGLAIVKAIVEAHSGNVETQSARRGWGKFMIDLPFV